jgi:DNA-binding MarR family transcriptional regulator
VATAASLMYIVSRYNPMPQVRDLSDSEYEALAELRYQIRRFLTFSEAAAREAGIEAQQHQLLLVLRALPPQTRPTVRAVAERLQIQHNSAVELAKRSVERGLVERRAGQEDRREVSLHLTRAGQGVLRRLSLAHRAELRAAAPSLVGAVDGLLSAVMRKRT